MIVMTTSSSTRVKPPRPRTFRLQVHALKHMVFPANSCRQVIQNRRPLSRDLRFRRAKPASTIAPAARRTIVPGSGTAAAVTPTALPPPPCDSGERRRASPCSQLFPTDDRRRSRSRRTQRDRARTDRRRGAEQRPNARAAAQHQPPAAADRHQPAAGQGAGGGHFERAAADVRPAGVAARAAEINSPPPLTLKRRLPPVLADRLRRWSTRCRPCRSRSGCCPGRSARRSSGCRRCC